MRVILLVTLVAASVAVGKADLIATHPVSPWSEHTHECMHDSPEVQNIQRELEKNVAPQAYMTGGDDFTIPPQHEEGGASAHRSSFHAMAVGSMRIVLSTADLDTPGRYCASATDRIPDYGGGTVACSAEGVLTAAKKDFLVNKILPAAMQRLSAALSVNRVQGNLKAPSTSVCAYHTVPLSHVTTGVPNADFVIYIASAPISSGAIAWATYCARDTNGRPVLGRMNFSPKFITWSDTDLKGNEAAIDTATHELIHALGFTYSMLSTLSGVVSSVTVRGGAPKKAIVTTNARAQYRSFIGCDRAIGPELEDEGGDGTQLSHWERRNLKDDIMTGAGGTQLSAVTLGLLEDTGYYYANYGTAESMLWGKQAGCPFIEDKCNTLASGMNKYWCDDTAGTQRYCTYDYRAYGGCYITTTATTILPSYFQYFSDPKIQGTGQFMDHCPVIGQYLNSECDTATHVVSSSEDYYGYTFGTTGRCFVTSVNFAKWSGGNAGAARCFVSRCPNGNRVQVKVRDTDWLNCPMDGSAGVISGPAGWVGTINCPKAADFCTPELYYGAVTPTPATPVPATPKPATPVPATPKPATPVPATPKPATPVPATPKPATPAPMTPSTPASTIVTVAVPTSSPTGTPMPAVSDPGITLSPGTPAPSTTKYAVAHSTGAAYTTAMPVAGVEEPSGAPAATQTPTQPPALYSEVMSATFRVRGSRWRRFGDGAEYAKLKDAVKSDVARALGVTVGTIMITKLAIFDDFVYVEFVVKYPMVYSSVTDGGAPSSTLKSSVELQQAFNQVAVTGSVDWLTATVELYQPLANETLTVTDAATAIPPTPHVPTDAATPAPPVDAPLTTAAAPEKVAEGRVGAGAVGPSSCLPLAVVIAAICSSFVV